VEAWADKTGRKANRNTAGESPMPSVNSKHKKTERFRPVLKVVVEGGLVPRP